MVIKCTQVESTYQPRSLLISLTYPPLNSSYISFPAPYKSPLSPSHLNHKLPTHQVFPIMACFGRIAFIFALLFFSLALVSNARHDPVHHSRHRQKFVSVKGSHFSLKRSPFLFNGFNSYWMMSVAADLNMRHQVTQVFRDASAAGMSVCRTWAFADGGSNALQLSPGNYDERVFQVSRYS